MGVGTVRCSDLVRRDLWRHLARFDFKRTPVFVATTLPFAVAAMAGHFVVGAFIGPYAVGHRRGSFEETTDISRTVAVTTRPVISGAGTHPFLT